MTDTLERTDTLDDLDFAPRCVVRLRMIRSGNVSRQCEREAVWAGNLPCCGGLGLLCEAHFKERHRRKFGCGRCKRNHVDLLNWRRI